MRLLGDASHHISDFLFLLSVDQVISREGKPMQLRGFD
jgi:hypothetical protein